MTDRKKFIKFLFERLEAHRYVLLKHIDRSVVEIDEKCDLDFLISKKEIGDLFDSITGFEGVKKIDRKNQSTMSQAFIFFKDNSFLQLDFLFGFYRKGLVYLNCEEVFEFSITNDEGIRVCSNRHLMEHLLLFNFLNFSGIPQKYLRYFEMQTPEEMRDILTYLKAKYAWNITSISDLAKYHPGLRKALINYLAQKEQNNSIPFLKNRINYFFDTLKNVFSNRGFIMTFSGVDGAGKSTIINQVKETLEGKYRRNVVVLRHRPSILPILSAFRHGKEKAEKIASQTLPRQGNNSNMPGSLLRFAYYYFDYLLGQFYVKARYVWRGYIVIYDRYYFDFIVDSKRSNIKISQAIPRFLYRFVEHPALNLFLYAKPETILQRKKEMDADSINELTSDYKTLFESLKNENMDCKYLPIENINMEATLQQIIEQYEAMI